MASRSDKNLTTEEALLSFALWVEYGLRPSIKNVIELKRANPTVPVQTLTDYLTKRAGHNANVVRQ
jgi:hypothetical protein